MVNIGINLFKIIAILLFIFISIGLFNSGIVQFIILILVITGIGIVICAYIYSRIEGDEKIVAVFLVALVVVFIDVGLIILKIFL